jgi:cell wall-associated NlpC family hydrolase
VRWFAVGAFVLCLVGSCGSAKADLKTTDAKAASPDIVYWTPHLAATRIKPAGGVDRFAARIAGRMSRLGAQLTRTALRFVGTPYVFGGSTPRGFDCSGYVQYVFARFHLHIPRTADAQYFAAKPISGPLIPGDLVFFQTYLPGPSHVGIYLGDGTFVHSAGRAVKVSRLSDSYYAMRYLRAKRFLGFAR